MRVAHRPIPHKAESARRATHGRVLKIFKSKKGRSCAISRNFRAFPPFGRSVTEANPLFQNFLFFSGVETP